jgi:hypothetical protein
VSTISRIERKHVDTEPQTICKNSRYITSCVIQEWENNKKTKNKDRYEWKDMRQSHARRVLVREKEDEFINYERQMELSDNMNKEF